VETTERAVRVDLRTAVREEVCFFGRDGHRMFGCTHRPAAAPIAGVVICSPLQSEFLANYRREVILARCLTERGFAVQRFHYRGTGHSDGETRDVTFDTMVDDAASAVGWLRERTGVSGLAFVGTRLGGMVAAAAAAQLDEAPLILWEPAVDGGRYFRDVFRSVHIYYLKEGRVAPPTEGMLDEIRRTGTLTMLGFSIDLPLYESVESRRLVDEVGQRTRPLLLVQIDRAERLRSEYADLVAQWRNAGFTVETHSVVGQDAWWLRGAWWRDQEMLRRIEALAPLTSDWLTASFMRGNDEA